MIEAGDAAIGITTVRAELDHRGLQTLRIDVLLGRGALRVRHGCKRCGKKESKERETGAVIAHHGRPPGKVHFTCSRLEVRAWRNTRIEYTYAVGETVSDPRAKTGIGTADRATS